MYREAPFTDLFCDPLQPLGWWEARSKDSNTSILLVHNFSFSFLAELEDLKFSMLHSFLASNCSLCHHQKCVTSVWLLGYQHSTQQNAMVLVQKTLSRWLSCRIIGYMVLDKPSHTHTTALQLPKTHTPPSSKGLRLISGLISLIQTF